MRHPPPKTMAKALRASQPLKPPPGVQIRTIERMQKLIGETLDAPNGNKSAWYLFLLNYLSTVVNFHQAVDQKIKDEFLIQIKKYENQWHLHDFSQEEITSLNFIVLKVKAEGHLSALSRRIEEIITPKKRRL